MLRIVLTDLVTHVDSSASCGVVCLNVYFEIMSYTQNNLNLFKLCMISDNTPDGKWKPEKNHIYIHTKIIIQYSTSIYSSMHINDLFCLSK